MCFITLCFNNIGLWSRTNAFIPRYKLVKISAPSEIVFFLLVKKRGGVLKNENPTLSPNACQLRPLINPEPLGRFRRNFAQSWPWAGSTSGKNFSPIGDRLLLTR